MLTIVIRQPVMRSMLRRVVAIAAAFAAGLAAAPPAAAGVEEWTPVGPPGGTFSSVAGGASSPETILAATYTGVIWRSTDGGVTWGLAGAVAGGTLNDPPQLAVDPSRTTTVYASTTPSGAWKSTDGGATWRQLAAGITGLAIAPGAPATLYATQYVSGPGPGSEMLLVEASADAGATWKIAGMLPHGWQAAREER